MKEKINRKLRPLSIVLFFALFGFSHGFAETLASMKDSHPLKEDLSQSSLAGQEQLRAASPLWRSFLWEALPAEWLSDPTRSVIPEAYQQREWRPFFIDSRFELTREANSFLARLEKLENDAIDPKLYRLPTVKKSIEKLDQLRASLGTLDPKFLDANAEPAEISSFDGPDASSPHSHANQYAAVSPETRSADTYNKREKEQKYREIFKAASEMDIRLANLLVRFTQEMNPFYKEKLDGALSGSIPFSEFLEGLEPVSPHYEPLRGAYAKYRQFAVQFPHQRTVGGAVLRIGDSGNEVRELQKRLQLEGFHGGKITGSFDEATLEAVKRFQASHLLDADGVVGPATKDCLNVSYDQKAKMIAHSMKTLRQSQTRQYDTFVRINIPQFVLEYYREGKIRNTHRVIVGKASGKKVRLGGRFMGENHTPPISSAIEHVVINPRWYITKRILAELSDTVAADPNYFARHGYVRTSSSQGESRIFQLPGPTNPLGRIKFEFPNAYTVFLHDTPKKQLFQRTRRDFSHGCVRVEGAQQLAQSIVTDDNNPAADKIDSYLGKNSPTYIRLNKPVPIVLEYMTAVTDEKGRVVFYNDIYGWFKDGFNPKS